MKRLFNLVDNSVANMTQRTFNLIALGIFVSVIAFGSFILIPGSFDKWSYEVYEEPLEYIKQVESK